MTPTWRKPVGAIAIIAIIIGWCALIATFSATIGAWPGFIQLPFYVVGGIIWIFPLKPVLLWMETGHWRRSDQLQDDQI